MAEASGRLSGEGLATVDQEQTTCCFAVQDKVWVEDPDGAPWEVYTVLADAPVESGIAGDGTCCVAEGLEVSELRDHRFVLLLTRTSQHDPMGARA